MAGGGRKEAIEALLDKFGVASNTVLDRQVIKASGGKVFEVSPNTGTADHVVMASRNHHPDVNSLAAMLARRGTGSGYKASAEEVAGYAAELRKRSGLPYGADQAENALLDQQLMAMAYRQQRLGSIAWGQRKDAQIALLNLAQENPNFRQQLLPYMGIDPAVLNARSAAPAAPAGDPAWVVEAARQQAYGAGRSAADLEHAAAMAAAQEQHAAAMAEAQRMIDAAKVTPQPPPPATGNAAANTPPPGGDAPAADAAAKSNANPREIRPEVDNWWTASSPLLKDVPVLKDIPNWGYVGAGAAGASALAYHLLMAGQQQQNNAAYAAQVQAMNAY